MAAGSPGPPAELAALLRLSASGDTDAFARFYDLTCDRVLRHELARAHLRGGPAAGSRAVAETMARERYLRAWSVAAEQPSSGLSPLAWLLALPITRQPGTPSADPAVGHARRVAVAG